jgi:DNA uptake protein ComE-like DNA-binding protein
LPVPAPRSRWPWLSLLPLGLGAWAPIYAGVRARVRSWIVWGAAWSVVTLAGWTVAVANSGGAGGGLLIIAGWVGAIATSFMIRAPYDRQIESPLTAAADAAALRLSDRRRALELARANPSLAAEVGIGRPDRPGAADAGLVDINNAAVTALMALPGIDGDLATRIVETRAEVNGFSSLEDLGSTLDLPGDAVERLRGQAVFLPRST